MKLPSFFELASFGDEEGGDIESRHRFDPLQVGRKGMRLERQTPPRSCNLCNMTVDASRYCFWNDGSFTEITK